MVTTVMLNNSISVIRYGERVLTNEVLPGDLVPGFGPEDERHVRGDGTYEEFLAAYQRVRASNRPSGMQGPNYSI